VRHLLATTFPPFLFALLLQGTCHLGARVFWLEMAEDLSQLFRARFDALAAEQCPLADGFSVPAPDQDTINRFLRARKGNPNEVI
jgi:hypothetical protein